jgi:hypothetical protein
MSDHGLRVQRLLNSDVVHNLEGELTDIRNLVGATPPPDPLPQREGENSVTPQ